VPRVALACLLLALLIGSACEDGSLRAREEHVLNRIGYGPDPWSRARIRALGIDAYIEEQLHPARLDDSALETRLRAEMPALSMSLAEARSYYNEFLPPPSPRPSEVMRQMARAKVLRAIHSRRQLEQVLVDFWLNHFNVDARSEIARWGIVTYERDVLRPLALGRFEDLLRAVARHPAMLDYLDNAQNFREGFVRDRESYGVNENFAREVLEVHTVGPDAGQTLADVRNTALAFTGWTIPLFLIGDDPGFVFVPEGHDPSAKSILGLSLPAGGGISDGDALIRYLARHPSTAAHVSRKLCRRFVAERATGCEVAAAARFLASDGNIREVMREILGSPDFRDPRWFRTKVKRPLHAIASVARAVGVADDEEFAPLAHTEARNMGEDLYAAGAPVGWPDVSRAWVGEGAFVLRLNLAHLAARGVWGLRPPAAMPSAPPDVFADQVAARLLLGPLGLATRAELIDFLRDLPEYARLEEASTLVLSSPDFAHH
jgi:uncharacterized protein (DUF1800 family)